MLVGDMIRATAARYPEKVGIISGGDRYTWREVNQRVNGLAHGLIGMGLNKPDRVAILCRNSHQYLEFYLATAKAGLVAVPLNTWYREKELSYLINDSGARALVIDQDYLEVASKLETDCVEHYLGFGESHPYPHDLETIIAENPHDEPEVSVDESDLFALSYTSGTTGKPKGTMITHRNCCAGVLIMVMELRIHPDSVYLLHAPMFFSAGGGGRLTTVLRGCRTIVMQYEVNAILRAIERERITHFTMSPTPIKRIADHPDVGKYDLTSVRMIGLTGAPHSIAEIRRIEEVFGHVWHSCWGMTETCSSGITLPPEEVEIDGPLSRRMASVGKPMPGFDVRAVNEDGEDIARNGKETGELIIRGDAVTAGYWNMPEETAETVRDGWLYTGDVVTIDEDGYIYIVDRKKDMIKSGGILVSAREIEEVIYRHPAVAYCAVIGVPDEDWGETPKAIVVLKEGMKATENEIIELCRQNLASYKKPTSVDFSANLPLTSTGKILKKDIREAYWRGYHQRVH